jgi:KaiC/GvpD/RAD55 family RecA-like ATPase
MNLLYLIKYLLNITNYTKYRRYIKVNKETDKEVYLLYKTLDKLIEKYNTTLSIDDYNLTVLTTLGNEYTSYLKIIEEGSINDELIEDTLQTIRDRSNAYDLAHLAIEVSEGRKTFEDILDFVDSTQENKNHDTRKDPFVTTNLHELLERTTHSKGLRWRLAGLNRSLGSLRAGDFGFIFARPETGKTTFLASEATFFAHQTDSPILWFNNEEQGEKVMLRCEQAALGLTLQQIENDVSKNHENYINTTKDNLKIIDSASLHKSYIQHLVKEYKPALIIFDQIDKIKGFEADRNDLRLGAIYQWARELAKQHCPIIGVCQSDGTGEGKKWLTMDNVADSKTAKQAEADFIIGIGKTHDPGLENVRFLNISKNKLHGDVDSDPSLRHGKLEVLIQPNIGRYLDI